MPRYKLRKYSKKKSRKSLSARKRRPRKQANQSRRRIYKKNKQNKNNSKKQKYYKNLIKNNMIGGSSSNQSYNIFPLNNERNCKQFFISRYNNIQIVIYTLQDSESEQLDGELISSKLAEDEAQRKHDIDEFFSDIFVKRQYNMDSKNIKLKEKVIITSQEETKIELSEQSTLGEYQSQIKYTKRGTDRTCKGEFIGQAPIVSLKNFKATFDENHNIEISADQHRIKYNNLTLCTNDLGNSSEYNDFVRITFIIPPVEFAKLLGVYIVFPRNTTEATPTPVSGEIILSSQPQEQYLFIQKI